MPYLDGVSTRQRSATPANVLLGIGIDGDENHLRLADRAIDVGREEEVLV